MAELGLLRDHQGDEEPALRCRAPPKGRGEPGGAPGGRATQEDHERVLWTVIGAGWPNREPTWPAFLGVGAVLRIMNAEANNWLPRALRTALTHWRYRRRNAPPPQPRPHTSGGADDGRARRRWSQAMGTRQRGRTDNAGHPPGRTRPPNPERTPHLPALWRGGGERAGATSARMQVARGPHCPANR